MREVWSLVRGLPTVQREVPVEPVAQPTRFATTEETLAFFAE